MAKSDLAEMKCTVARSIALVGDQWTQMVLRELFLGSRRYDQLQRHTKISSHLLSVRLKTMESIGLVTKHIYSNHHGRFEYKLTEKGRDLWPVVIAFKSWGDKWLDLDNPQRQITLTHSTCGHTTNPILTCSACGDPISAITSTATISEEMQVERAAMQPANIRNTGK